MVIAPPGGQRGTSLFGCLISLVLLAVAVWYGSQIGLMYWRRYQILDEMKVSARHASGLSDLTVRNRLENRVREVFGPERTLRFEISRPQGRHSLLVETEYRDSVDLPLLQRGFPFKLRVEQP